jgi:hypothetical protein
MMNSVLRGVWFAALLLIPVSCGGGPAAPTQTPPPPPQLVGEWLGAVVISSSLPPPFGQVQSVCNHEWTVAAQTGRQFSGHFRAPFGGQATFPRPEACLETGDFNGTLTATGEITSLTYNLVLGASLDCTAVTRAAFTGTGVNGRIDARATDTVQCLVNDRLEQINRTLQVQLFERR